MTKQPFDLIARIRGFKHAFRGIWLIFKTQHNMWIHLLAIVFVIALGIYTNLNLNEWLFIVFAIGLVLVAELVNTGIEYLGDAITDEENEKVRNAKDVSAGAVLMAALVALVIAGMVFIPRVIPLFTS
ncbi:MAG TPA: diacylglycerol kinase family protein [Flavobacteriales bacterium]|nr:diacylglycerol kinase family protein [Flavobacteriales bacterium]